MWQIDHPHPGQTFLISSDRNANAAFSFASAVLGLIYGE